MQIGVDRMAGVHQLFRRMAEPRHPTHVLVAPRQEKKSGLDRAWAAVRIFFTVARRIDPQFAPPEVELAPPAADRWFLMHRRTGDCYIVDRITLERWFDNRNPYDWRTPVAVPA